MLRNMGRCWYSWYDSGQMNEWIVMGSEGVKYVTWGGDTLYSLSNRGLCWKEHITEPFDGEVSATHTG